MDAPGDGLLISLVILTLTRDIHLQNKLRKRTDNAIKTASSGTEFLVYRFSGSGLQRGMENHIFWSEIESGF